jgi:uncharacterized protein YcfL
MSNDSIRFVAQSIKKSPLIEKNKIFYQKFTNIFDNNLVNRINNTVDSLKTEQLQNQHTVPRKKSIDSEKLVKELKIIFSHSSIRAVLEEKYNQKFKINSCDFWYDTKGYFLPPHIDNDSIKLSLQIYLSEDTQPGTVLFDDLNSENYFDIFPFRFNSGYSMLHDGNSFHGLEYPVKEGVRKSLYIRFS